MERGDGGRGRRSGPMLRARADRCCSPTRAAAQRCEPHLVPMDEARLLMPFRVSEYTDFYAGKHHATNVGTMFRGAENALPPNWLSIPIGYNGRASSVVVSGTPVRRPWGQVKGPDDEMPRLAPSARFDIELEMGAIVGQPSEGHGLGGRGRGDDLRLRPAQRLVGARHPGVGIPAARARSRPRPRRRRSARGS